MKNLRLRLFLGHLAISAFAVGLSVAFIVLVWYPGALARLEDIYGILIIMIGVDVAAGPLCTLVVAAPTKSQRELRRDLSVIGGVQLLALVYAIYTTGVARPVYVVYSFDRFDVEHANQISRADVAKSLDPEFSSLPWLGPEFVEARLPDDKTEANRIIASTISGERALKDMPQYYQRWPANMDRVRRKARPVTDLWEKGELRPAADEIVRTHGLSENDALVVPIFSQTRRGSVVLRQSDLTVLGIIADLAP